MFVASLGCELFVEGWWAKAFPQSVWCWRTKCSVEVTVDKQGDAEASNVHLRRRKSRIQRTCLYANKQNFSKVPKMSSNAPNMRVFPSKNRCEVMPVAKTSTSVTESPLFRDKWLSYVHVHLQLLCLHFLTPAEFRLLATLWQWDVFGCLQATPGKFYSKLNIMFFGYLNPKIIFLYNKSKCLSGWPKRYFG